MTKDEANACVMLLGGAGALAVCVYHRTIGVILTPVAAVAGTLLALSVYDAWTAGA